MDRILHLAGSPGEALVTEGGPLVMLRLGNSARWESASHYDTACGVTDWLSFVDIDGLGAFVLGDEPASAWIQRTADGHTVVFRSIYQPEDHFPHGRVVLSSESKLQQDINIAPGGDFLLFDSAFDGVSAIEAGLGLVIRIPDSGSTVETYEYKPSPDVFLIAHVFRPQ